MARKPSEVIYQIYPASFCDANGDGHGDIQGITSKLDHIQSLNVDAIWISPFYLSPAGPEGDGGYAVTDYTAINPVYGDMDDFKALLDDAHDRGIKVYIDFVIAHTADDHKWFEKSRNREEPYDDYYVWHDGTERDGVRYPPNNWKSVFGGDAWSWDDKRGQYYLHHFLDSQPGLNHNLEKVQTAVLAEMKFWLDAGVDGFRIDALPFANHDPQLRHNPWLYGQWPEVHEDWDQQYFAHSMCQPQTEDLVKRISKLMDSYPDKKMTLGEVIAGPRGGSEAVGIAAGYVNGDEGLDMCYTDLGNSISHDTPHHYLKEMIAKIERFFPQGGHCVSISNHDFERLATRVTQNLPQEEKRPALRQIIHLMATMPGSICLYQGGELGLRQASIPDDIPVEQLKDPVAVTRSPDECRDGARTPMPWDSKKKNAGFSDADETYLPIPDRHMFRALDQQEGDADSILHFVRKLTKWRKQQPAILEGKTKVLDTLEPIIAFVRECEDQSMLCLFNMSNEAVCIKPADLLDEEMLARINVDKDKAIWLKPYGCKTCSAADVTNTKPRIYGKGQESIPLKKFEL